jgi:hypothetical protein
MCFPLSFVRAYTHSLQFTYNTYTCIRNTAFAAGEHSLNNNDITTAILKQLE